MKLGTININKPLILAPMENVTDKPFRLMIKRLDADIVYTEFTSSDALIRDIPKADSKIAITKDERPIGIQIFGSCPDAIAKAVEKVHQYNPEFIDINAGCWSRTHVNRGECAALLKDLPRFEAIIKKAVKSTTLPVTVKTRLGWDPNNIVILDVAKMVEASGAQALTVHCRTRNQAYKGTADWSWLEKIRKVIAIPLIGNGDVKSPEDAETLFKMGCEGVMIGREVLSNPWIFQEIKHYFKTGEKQAPKTLSEKIKICIEHLNLTIHYKGNHGIIPFRKFYCGYLKGIKNAAKIRNELMQIKNLDHILDILRGITDDNKTFF